MNGSCHSTYIYFEIFYLVKMVTNFTWVLFKKTCSNRMTNFSILFDVF